MSGIEFCEVDLGFEVVKFGDSANRDESLPIGGVCVPKMAAEEAKRAGVLKFMVQERRNGVV